MAQKRKIEKVLLMFPPVRLYRETMKLVFSPLGISYIAAVIRDEAEVKILDAAAEGFFHDEIIDDNFIRFGLPLPDIRKRIEEFGPDVLGVSCLFSSVFPMVREVCQEAKKVDPDMVTITGGTYPTFLPEKCLSEPSLDMIALGESEYTVLEVIRRLKEGRPFDDVDGLSYKDGDRVVVNPKTGFIQDLDSLPFPARDLLPMETYNRIGIPHSFSAACQRNAPVITSRGCPANCIYCSSTKFWGNRYRLRSPDNVLDEIEELIEKWDIEEVQFEDDNITANKKRAKLIFQGIIDRGFNIKLNFPNGLALWTLDEELVDIIKQAGAYELTLAIESGCQEVLKNIVKKPLNLDKALKITEYIRRQGLRTTAFYIYGFPGETRQQMEETYRFAKKMKTDMAFFFVANPLPGTELYRMARERGMLRGDFAFENVMFTRSAYHEGVYPKGELERLAGRSFLKYNLYSYLKHPMVLFKKSVVDLLFKRPKYTFGVVMRVIRRNLV